MTAVRMYCFDQFPSRSTITTTHMAAEGYTDLDFTSSSSAGAFIASNKGRQSLGVNFNYIDASYAVGRTLRMFLKSARQLFGNPSVVTKGVFGIRVDITAMGYTAFSQASSLGLLWIEGTAADGGVMYNIPQGEHFIEIEIDFVNKTVSSYLNGNFKVQTSYPNLTLDSLLQISPNAAPPGRNVSGTIMYVTDMYFTYDNQDGDFAGRLGPCRVYNMPVEEIEVPASWKGFDETQQNYSLSDGTTWQAVPIVSKLASEGDFIDQWNIAVSPAFTGGGAQYVMGESGTRSYWTAGNAVPLSITYTFPEGRKASGYVLQSYTTSGFFDAWKFQGSNDGTNWVDLDTRTGMGAYFQAQASRVVAFKVPAGKIGVYKQYRLLSTANLSSGGYVQLYQFNLLAEPADLIDQVVRPALSRTVNNGVGDYDTPVLRTSIDGAEGSIGFKVPDIGVSDIVAVKLNVSARRDQGSAEHLVAKVKVGDKESAPVDYELKAHIEDHYPLANLQKVPNGAAWTKADLESLRVVLKTKRGAN